jgi:hypothetical protein
MQENSLSNLQLAAYYMQEHHNRRSANHRMRVVFVVQNEVVWDKQAPIYDAFVKDGDVDVFLVLLPSYTGLDAQEKHPAGRYEEKYWKYFHDRYADVYDFTNIMDLCSLAPDYIFLALPYEELRPLRGSRTRELAQAAKLCYLDYGVPCSQFFLHAWSKEFPFFSYLSFGFCDSAEEKNAMDAGHPCAVHGGLQHFEALGYPAYERYLTYAGGAPPEQCRILWTPRWTTDAVIGGSHFFAYKDHFVEFAARYGSDTLRFGIRPHPLMFSHFIQQGMMTEEEVLRYKRSLAKHDIELDEEKYTLFEALTSTDILLTDFSSINMFFFLLDRPMIYCPQDAALTDDYTRMVESSYIADTWEQVETYLLHLIRGEDPLAEQRRHTVAKFHSLHVGAAARIVHRLKTDHAESTHREPIHLLEVDRWIFEQKKFFVPYLLNQPAGTFAYICEQSWYDNYLTLIPLQIHDKNLQWGLDEILSILQAQYHDSADREKQAYILLAMLLFADPLTLPMPLEIDLWPKELYWDIQEVFEKKRRAYGIG